MWEEVEKKGGSRKGTGWKNGSGRKTGRVHVFCWKSGLWPRLIANKCCRVSTLKTSCLGLCDGKKRASVNTHTHTPIPTHTHTGWHMSKRLSLHGTTLLRLPPLPACWNSGRCYSRADVRSHPARRLTKQLRLPSGHFSLPLISFLLSLLLQYVSETKMFSSSLLNTKSEVGGEPKKSNTTP